MIAGLVDDSDMEKVNEWLNSGDHQFGEMKRIDREAGGTRGFERVVWAAGFNFFDMWQFAAFLKTIEWRYGRPPSLLYCGQEDDKFEVWDYETQ